MSGPRRLAGEDRFILCLARLYLRAMTLRLRALSSSCLLVALVACAEPPSAGDAKSASAPTPAAAKQPEAPQYPVDPVFEGKPISTNTLPGGLIVEDFALGTGEEAKPGAEVSVHYVGTLADGTMFDTSYKRQRPFTFTIGEGRVIKGWDQGVPGMKVGGKRRLTVPAELAYGERKKGKIPPNSQLTFTIELVESVPPLPPPKDATAFTGEPLRRTELERGLVLEDYADGEGRVAAAGDKVSMHYTGTLDDGTVFDSSVPRKKPLTFVLGTKMVIEGWDLGIAGMKVGGLRKLIIPAELAYGDRGKGKIPANSRLTFTVELMAVKDAPAQPAARPRIDSPRAR
jgi:FKBP-type peptidyl-prolyl cis-trans isomerase